jgi:hypothetical protein
MSSKTLASKLDGLNSSFVPTNRILTGFSITGMHAVQWGDGGGFGRPFSRGESRSGNSPKTDGVIYLALRYRPVLNCVGKYYGSVSLDADTDNLYRKLLKFWATVKTLKNALKA